VVRLPFPDARQRSCGATPRPYACRNSQFRGVRNLLIPAAIGLGGFFFFPDRAPAEGRSLRPRKLRSLTRGVDGSRCRSRLGINNGTGRRWRHNRCSWRRRWLHNALFPEATSG
jgi:hypothetical protein